MGLSTVSVSMLLVLSGYASTSHFDIEGVATPRSSSSLTLRGLGSELEYARSDVLDALPVKLKSKVSSLRCRVVVAQTTEEFVRRSGVGPYHAAGSRGRSIFVQPFSLLAQYPDLASVLRHEFAHVVLEQLFGRQLERWLVEGLAMHLSGERPPPPTESVPSKETLGLAESILIDGRAPEKMKWAYRLAFDAVKLRIKDRGLKYYLSQLD